MISLKLGWRFEPQRGMEALTIVKRLDVIEDTGARNGAGEAGEIDVFGENLLHF